ncbi:hypothetical protein PAEPH01_0101 [Pancytospora epiphaga]|nr:hypothetical protein PAEPH01_0101 [Pancytospora epiphaga]
MSGVAVIQFRDKREDKSVTEEIQVDVKMDVVGMNAYVNMVEQKGTEYTFYYKNDRIKEGIQEIVERYNLDAEEVIIIDYIDNQMVIEDIAIPCEDVVTDICIYSDKMYARLYSGDVTILLGQDGVVRRQTRHIGAGDRLLSVEGNKIIEMETGNDIVEMEGEVKILKTRGNAIAIGLNDKRIVLLREGSRDEIITEDEYRSLIIGEDGIYWVESVDVIVKYNWDTKKKTKSYTSHTITCIEIDKGEIIAGTSNGVVLNIQEGSIKPYEVDVRIISGILVYEDVIILSSQNRILSFNGSTFEERSSTFLDFQINSMKRYGDKLMVANGTKVSGLLLSRL